MTYEKQPSQPIKLTTRGRRAVAGVAMIGTGLGMVGALKAGQEMSDTDAHVEVAASTSEAGQMAAAGCEPIPLRDEKGHEYKTLWNRAEAVVDGDPRGVVDELQKKHVEVGQGDVFLCPPGAEAQLHDIQTPPPEQR